MRLLSRCPGLPPTLWHSRSWAQLRPKSSAKISSLRPLLPQLPSNPSNRRQNDARASTAATPEHYRRSVRYFRSYLRSDFSPLSDWFARHSRPRASVHASRQTSRSVSWSRFALPRKPDRARDSVCRSLGASQRITAAALFSTPSATTPLLSRHSRRPEAAR